MGNKAFKEKKYESSIRSYKRGLDLINYSIDWANQAEMHDIVVSLNVNLAMAYNETGKPEKAIERCQAVLEYRPNHTKAMFQ